AKQFVISWGDGQISTYSTNPDYQGIFPHVYQHEGTWSVTATVETQDNSTFTAATTIPTQEATPLFYIADTGEAVNGQAFTVSAIYNDPGGDQPTYSVSWGDG